MFYPSLFLSHFLYFFPVGVEDNTTQKSTLQTPQLLSIFLPAELLFTLVIKTNQNQPTRKKTKTKSNPKTNLDESFHSIVLLGQYSYDFCSWAVMMLINSHKLCIAAKTSYFFKVNYTKVSRVVASQELSHPFDISPPLFCSLIHTLYFALCLH